MARSSDLVCHTQLSVLRPSLKSVVLCYTLPSHFCFYRTLLFKAISPVINISHKCGDLLKWMDQCPEIIINCSPWFPPHWHSVGFNVRHVMCNVIQDGFTALNSPPLIVLSVPHHLPANPRQPLKFYVSSFVFSRMPCSWNPIVCNLHRKSSSTLWCAFKVLLCFFLSWRLISFYFSFFFFFFGV